MAGAGPLENLRFSPSSRAVGHIFPIRNNCRIGAECGMIVWRNFEHEDGFGDGDEEWVAIS